MADATDDRLIAAHLAAAMIRNPPKGARAENAAKIYFDVLEAVRAEEKKRKRGKVATALIEAGASVFSREGRRRWNGVDETKP
jgi:hypothetical protein